MNWEKIKLTTSMSQTMFLDNQIYVGESGIIKSVKIQTLFFDKLVVNRAYLLNNPDLSSIVEHRAKTGFDNLMESGAIAISMAESKNPPSFKEEWKNAKEQEMSGLTTSEQYVNQLDQFIENLNKPVPYVTFNYSGASENYLSLIKDDYNRLKKLGETSKIKSDDLRKLEYLVSGEIPSEDITRSKLYTNFGIPLRGTDEYELVEHDPRYESTKMVKEILDINYNFNIPHLNDLNLEYRATHKPGPTDGKLYEINPPPVMCDLNFIDINKLEFDDIVNIRENCKDERTRYLKSYETLQKNYGEKNLESLAYEFRTYLNSIYDLFKNRTSLTYQSRCTFHFNNKYYKYGEVILMTHEINIGNHRDDEVVFNMTCNFGTPEDKHRTNKPAQERSSYNTNDTGIRGQL
jgi:hypothetical protein